MEERRLGGTRILLPRAEVADEALPEMLRSRGAVVDVGAFSLCVFRQRPHTARMRRTHLAGALVGLVALLPATAGYSAQRTRQGALARLATTGTLFGSDQDDAQESMVELAGHLQALYDLGRSSEPPTAGVREEIEERSGELVEAADRILGFVDRIRGSDDAEAPGIPEERYDGRTLRMVNTYLELVEPLRKFVNGEPLDGNALDDLRSGLRMIRALTLALPATDF